MQLFDGYFEWDTRKNEANIKKHGISFDEAAMIFEGPILSFVDLREDYEGHDGHLEVREISIGSLEGRTVLVVAHTDRIGNIRIISARRAGKREAKRYHEYCKKNH